MRLPVGKGARQVLWEFFQPGKGLGALLVEETWQLCVWAAEWVEVRALKVLEGGLDSEPSAEPVLRAKWRAGHIPSGISGY